jgi:hypothetical protein
MTDTNGLLVDPRRAACLCDVGGPGLIATVVIDADGTEHLVLAEADRIGDENTRVDVGCRDAVHEQLGPLPPGVLRRIATVRRTHRCGRPTATGGRCRIPVRRPGQPCGWHR